MKRLKRSKKREKKEKKKSYCTSNELLGNTTINNDKLQLKQKKNKMNRNQSACTTTV